jgi:hypothetical protein
MTRRDLDAKPVIQLGKTFCTSFKARSFHADATAISISSFELNSRLVRIPLDILKKQKSQRLCLANGVNDAIAKGNDSRISISVLIHCGLCNWPSAPKTSNVASDDENSDLPFLNLEKVMHKIELNDFAAFWQNVEND